MRFKLKNHELMDFLKEEYNEYLTGEGYEEYG